MQGAGWAGVKGVIFAMDKQFSERVVSVSSGDKSIERLQVEGWSVDSLPHPLDVRRMWVIDNIY